MNNDNQNNTKFMSGAEVRATLEKQQDIELRNSANSTTSERVEEVISRGGKIEDIKGAFAVEEALRKEVEKDRDENLQSYLNEREKRIKAEKEASALRKQIAEADRKRAEAIELDQKNRNDEYYNNQTDKNLREASRVNFEKLLESKKTFKINRQ